jgi:predicted RNase H-like HicB family nuclease
MNRYLVVFERANGNYSAFSPDLPGCVATGANRTEVETNIKQAIGLHIRGMKEDGLPLPEPASFTEYIEV